MILEKLKVNLTQITGIVMRMILSFNADERNGQKRSLLKIILMQVLNNAMNYEIQMAKLENLRMKRLHSFFC